MAEIKVRMQMGEEVLTRKQQDDVALNTLTVEDLIPKFEATLPFQLQGLVTQEEFSGLVGACNAVLSELGMPLAQEKLKLLTHMADNPCKSCCRVCAMCPCCCCFWPCCNPYGPMLEVARLQMKFQGEAQLSLAEVLGTANVVWEPKGIRWSLRNEVHLGAHGEKERTSFLVIEVAATNLGALGGPGLMAGGPPQVVMLAGGFHVSGGAGVAAGMPAATPTVVGVPVRLGGY